MAVEKTRAGGLWTEARYMSFIRSALRRTSMKWPPIYACKNDARRPNKSKNKKLKWEYKCSECKKWHQGKNVQVDHKEPAGSLKTLEDLPGFVARLFCEKELLCVLCKPCHKKKTNEEKAAKKKAKK